MVDVMDEHMTHPEPTALEIAVLQTVLYGDVFDFPLSLEEIHHYLIYPRPIGVEQVAQILQQSQWLQDRLCRLNGYYALEGRQTLFERRAAREQATRELLPVARRYARWIARMPFVRMVALTGALAVRSPEHAHDDLDYFIVAAEGRVWLARAFAILIVRVGRLFGVEVCPNYVASETALRQRVHNLYLAREVAQAIPLYGLAVFEHLRDENRWVLAILANALPVLYPEPEVRLGPGWGMLKRACEFVLCGRLGDALEQWEYRRKYRRFVREAVSNGSAARIAPDEIKGHFHDHGRWVLQRFADRLQSVGLKMPENAANESNHEARD
ncbi:MAG: hypothetical protein Kow0077_07000 [Anaerolineae bacterium]